MQSKMSNKVIHSNQTVILTNCDVIMKDCTMSRDCDLEKYDKAICEIQSLKSLNKSLVDLINAKDEKIDDLTQRCHVLTVGNEFFQAEYVKLYKKEVDHRKRILSLVMKVCNLEDQLREKSSDSTTDQLSKTLGSVDSEENDKLHQGFPITSRKRTYSF